MIEYSESGIFMAWKHSDGRLENGWFFGPLELVRWLKVYGAPLGVVDHIVVLRVG